MSEERVNRALFVVGMHRSGTSALSRVLSLAGAGLPVDLMQTGPHNPEGHWEPQPVADLNDHMFRALGARWHMPFPLDRSQATMAVLNKFKGLARDVLHQQFGRQSLIVLKEPRSTILADFWSETLCDLGYEPLTIVMMRDPGEVAVSLARRDGFALNHGLLLWASYMVQAELLTRRTNRLFCSYDELLADPHLLLKRIEQQFDVRLPFRTEARDEIEMFLQKDLRHHRSAGQIPVEAALDPVWRLAAWLRAHSAGHSPGEDVPAATLLWLETLGHIFGPIIAENDIALSAERIRSQRRITESENIRKSIDDIRSTLVRCTSEMENIQIGITQSDEMIQFEDPVSGRSRLFDPARYLALNPDVAQSGVDPWEHYNRSGRYEGRSL